MFSTVARLLPLVAPQLFKMVNSIGTEPKVARSKTTATFYHQQVNNPNRTGDFLRDAFNVKDLG